MSDTLAKVQTLAGRGEVQVSGHGYDELAADGMFFAEVVAGLAKAIVLEDYPTFAKGPCVLVLQNDTDGRPIHVVWGIPKDCTAPAVLVTAYRPDPSRWSSDFMKRKTP